MKLVLPFVAAASALALTFAACPAAAPATPATTRAAASTTKAASRPASPWRLRPGVRPELQDIIDSQAELRRSELQALGYDIQNLQIQLRSRRALSRRNSDARKEHAGPIEEVRKQVGQLIAERTELERHSRLSTGQYTTFVTGGKLSARNITIGGSRACWFNYVDARVVEVIDARSAVVVPRYLRRVSVNIRGVEENSWGEAVMRAVEMSPVVAIGLSSTEGWKTGDVVPFGHLWVVGPRRTIRIGDVERELDEIEPFTMDAFERVTPPR